LFKSENYGEILRIIFIDIVKNMVYG
jgi:hypothetical protein